MKNSSVHGGTILHVLLIAAEIRFSPVDRSPGGQPFGDLVRAVAAMHPVGQRLGVNVNSEASDMDVHLHLICSYACERP